MGFSNPNVLNLREGQVNFRKEVIKKKFWKNKHKDHRKVTFKEGLKVEFLKLDSKYK